VDDTPNLGLPYIMAAQSQKHVTHNEAIRALDAMVQLSVLDRDLSAPPVSPAEGARYIVGGSPTGAWSGHAGKVAAFQDGAWMLYAPVEGWIAWIGDEDVAVVWDGTAWSALTTGSGGGGSFATLGINATADTTNRLTLAADATLLNHDGDGHQLKINKASASDTASLLYQDAFSGRAELGLAGDDDFHFKVSPDGTTWKEAIVIDRSTGVVTFPFTSLSGGREVLTADRTYYVRADGSDSNDGLANTSGGAFLTRQHAYDVITSTLDLGGKTVTIKLADGTYSGALLLAQPWTGGGSIVLEGNTTTPANVIVSSADGVKVACVLPGILKIKGFKFTPTAAAGIYHNGVGRIEYEAIDFGSGGSPFCHIAADVGGATVVATGNYSISAGAGRHLFSKGAYLEIDGRTVTLTGTPAFSQFVEVIGCGGLQSAGSTWSGAATGARYLAALNGAINTGSGGASYFPGNAVGSALSGGQYV
jgi:hypothetical protein